MPLRLGTLALAAIFAVVLLVPSPVAAQEQRRIGGHVGFVVPLVNRSNGVTTTVADDFVIGFPTGFGLKKFGRVTLDLELVPELQNSPSDLSLTIHPGLIVGLGNKMAGGVRAAFDVEGHAWGFTPLLNRTLYVARTHSLFGEFVLPVRFVDQAGGSRTAVGFGAHIGVGF